MPTIIYLHGFASIGTSPKSDALVAAFGRDCVFSPDLPTNPNQTVTMVSEMVHQVVNFPLIFVGTSLGGFWAHYFAQQLGAACIMVNPSMNPAKKIVERVGKTYENYKTGELFTVTADYIAGFARCQSEVANLHRATSINLFLAEDDDVIDYRETCALMTHYDSRTITPDGGHRYAEHWDKVVDKARELARALA
ncbi:MAG: hypothetical protein PHI11_07135 [Gallionella sp.]|nr:hypothetical protein [Gallionella sp.]